MLIYICRCPQCCEHLILLYMRHLPTLSALFVAASCFAEVSCSLFDSDVEDAVSVICMEFIDDSYFETKSVLELPDTNDFILDVREASGKSVYKGKYGDSPERIEVKPGSYTINVSSSEVSLPKFDAPVFGDEQCVVVRSGENCRVRLMCNQLNSGVKLKIDKKFLTAYPNAALLLKSTDGSLLYSYSERRTAYFNPGTVSLFMTENSKDTRLYTKNLRQQEMLVLTVNVSASSASEGAVTPGSSSTAFRLSVDSARVWYNEACTIGGGSAASPGGGSSSADALTIAKAKDRVGDESVWITGYVVGGDLTSASMSFDGPFKSKTNIVIGPRSSTDEKESCMSVNLPTGELRNVLNLVDNPEILGKKILLKGDIVASYYGIPGIKNLSDYILK